MTTPLHTLTPKDILDLRASVRWRGSVDIDRAAACLMTYSASERAFILSAYGRVMAMSPDPAILAACMVAERAQTGFLAALLDTTVDPETACLNPAQRAARLSAIRTAAATVKHTTATLDHNRRLQHLRPSTISLDDLLDDTP